MEMGMVILAQKGLHGLLDLGSLHVIFGIEGHPLLRLQALQLGLQLGAEALVLQETWNTVSLASGT